MKAAARWSFRDAPPAEDLARALALPPIVARILAARGYDDPARARQFLAAGLEDLTPLAALSGIDAAADLLLAAIGAGERITIYGDYDADGVCATAILVRTLRAVGADARAFLPHRMREGYGLAADAIRDLAAGGTRLLVTVDCGVGAVDEIALARELGMRTIVLDHHEPPPALPDADVLVDLKTQDAVFREYCAAGLAWRFAGAVRTRAGLPASDDLLELAALATIADVVPLVGDNRILVRHGLARLGASPLPGVRALLHAAGVNPQQPGLEREVAWRLAPRLNAAGRIESAEQALALLTTDDAREAMRLANALDETNRKRQEVHDQVLAEAFAVVAEEGLGERPGLVVWGEGWHPGVVGIAAGRLRESFHRPVVLLSIDGDMARGSARSIPGLNLVEALHDSRDLLDRYGGHAAAAGVSLPADRLTAFRDRFEAAVRARVTDEDFVPRVEIDAEVPFAAIDDALATVLDALRPYGAGNPEPVLAVRDVAVADVAALGGGEHLRLLLTDGSSTREAVAFRQGELGDVLLFTQPRVDVAFRLQRRLWQNRTQIQCVVDDLRTPGVDLGSVLTDARALVGRLFDHRDDYLGTRGRGAEAATVVQAPLAGGSFDRRQEAIGTLSMGDAVTLIREPGNPRDPHAIRVDAAGGEILGYVPRWLAGRLAPEIDRGVRYRAIAERLTGGGDAPRGVDLRIERADAIDAPERGESDLVRLALADDDATLLRRLAIHVLRGQALDEANAASVREVLAGERRITLGPPGSGAWAALVAAAAARAARGSPSVFVFPTVELLDLRARWWRSMLAAVGVRSQTLHGLLPVEEREGVLAQLGSDRDASSAPDVLFTTAAAWERYAATLTPLRDAAALIGEGWTTPELPPFARAHPGPVLWNAWTTTVADGFATAAPPRVRTNLRIADRRGSTSGQAVLAALAAGGERTIAFAATAEESVTVAAALRSADSSRADRIAYDHDGLPPRVRETLYGLLSAGRLSVLVCAGAPGEEARISGVRHLAWLAFPDDWHTFLVQAASAGLGREEATLHVAFGEDEVAGARARLAARHPSRAALAALFRVLRSRPAPLSWPDPELAAAIADNGGPATVDIEPALRILVEAGVLRMTGGEGDWRIEVAPADRRYELRDAIAYAEGEASRAAFAFAVARLSRAGAAILEAAAGVAGSPVSDAG